MKIKRFSLRYLMPIAALSAVLWLAVGCAGSGSGMTLREHPTQNTPVYAAGTPRVLTFNAATRDEPGFDTVYASYESYLAALAEPEEESLYTESLFLTLDRAIDHNLYFDEDGRLIFMAETSAKSGGNDYWAEYGLFKSNGITTEQYGPVLGHNRKVLGFTFISDGRLLVITMNPEQQTFFSVYDSDFNALTKDKPWNGSTNPIISMVFYNNRIYTADSTGQYNVNRMDGSLTRNLFMYQSLNGLFADGKGLLYGLGRNPRFGRYTYFIYNISVKKMQEFSFENSRDEQAYFSAYNPADGFMYALGNNEVGRLENKTRPFVRVLTLGKDSENVMRQDDDLGNWIDGFVFDSEGCMYIALRGEAETKIWQYTPVVPNETAQP